MTLRTVLEEVVGRVTDVVPDEVEPLPLVFQRVIPDETGDEMVERRARLRLAELARRGVPVKDLERIAAETLASTPALEAARQFLSEPESRILVLSGGRGTGKTTAAAWIIGQECPDDYAKPWEAKQYLAWPTEKHPRFIDVSHLSRVSRYKAEDMVPLETCSMLAIDDLGYEYADEKGSFLSTLDGLWNTRYAAQLRTVVTTNLPAKEFRDRYGERFVDRIREMGRFYEVAGESLRGRP